MDSDKKTPRDPKEYHPLVIGPAIVICVVIYMLADPSNPAAGFIKEHPVAGIIAGFLLAFMSSTLFHITDMMLSRKDKAEIMERFKNVDARLEKLDKLYDFVVNRSPDGGTQPSETDQNRRSPI